MLRLRKTVNKKTCDSSLTLFVDKLNFLVKAVSCDHIPFLLYGGAFEQPIFEFVIEFVYCDFGNCCAHDFTCFFVFLSVKTMTVLILSIYSIYGFLLMIMRPN